MISLLNGKLIKQNKNKKIENGLTLATGQRVFSPSMQRVKVKIAIKGLMMSTSMNINHHFEQAVIKGKVESMDIEDLR